MSNCFRRRDIERVHGQSNQATVARERDCLDQLLANVKHLSAMEGCRASITPQLAELGRR